MEHLKKNEVFASILIVIAGGCWGMIGLFSRALSEAGLESLQIGALRVLVSFGSLLIIILATNPNQLRIRLRDMWLFIGSGVLSIAFFNVCYFMSIEENTLSLAAIILYTAPSLVILMSKIVFKEKITGKKLASLTLSFAGTFFAVGMFSHRIETSLYGMIVGLGSGLGYALYSIFSRIALRKYGSVTIMVYTFFFASMVLLPFSNPAKIYDVMVHTPTVLISLFALGWLSTLIPFWLYTKGLEHLEVGKAALLTFVEPVVATITGVVAFHEALTAANSGGILLIILSLVILNIKFKIPIHQTASKDYNKV